MFFNKNPYKADEFPAHLPKLRDMYSDLFADGKGFRSRLVKMISGPLNIDSADQDFMCQIIEFVHNASLLHDDLIDQASLRRGKTAAWLKYSAEYAVLGGDYLLARVMLMLSRKGNIQLVGLTSKAICDLIEGEWLQDAIVGKLDLSRAELDRVHISKTASLKTWCLQAPFYIKENYDPVLHAKLQDMGHCLGILFQRADDLLDYDIRNTEKKALLGDLKAGYLNSFGLRLVEKFDLPKRKEFCHLQSMEEVYKFLGREHFSECLEAFDNENKKLIENYAQMCLDLNQILNNDKLVKELQPLAKLLYWR